MNFSSNQNYASSNSCCPPTLEMLKERRNITMSTLAILLYSDGEGEQKGFSCSLPRAAVYSLTAGQQEPGPAGGCQ